MQNVCFLQVKSFGDFVIATAAAERVAEDARDRVEIAIGTHLQALRDALASSVRTVFLDTKEAGVPALFDLRKKGLAAATRSAFDLRQAIAGSALEPSTVMLLDRRSARERFILGGRRAATIHNARNIYAGYDQLMSEAGLRPRLPTARDHSVPLSAGIFPGSRLTEKNLPPDLVRDALAELERHGIPHKLFLLDGERPDLEASGLPFERVPRQFSAMCDAVSRCQLVVSADSLPAHLAERAGAEVFLFTPKPNEFWMPPSVFENRRWSLIGDPKRMDRLNEILRH